MRLLYNTYLFILLFRNVSKYYILRIFVSVYFVSIVKNIIFVCKKAMEDYSTNERRADIIQILNQKNRVMIAELCERYGLSEVTIRKDLEILKKRNLLFRIRGGAIRIPSTADGNSNDARIEAKRLFYYKQKRAIGRMAISLINENETIIIDSGTTTMEIAKNLHNFQNLTIVTNAIDIALEVSKYNRFNVILLGGHLRESSLSTVGPLAESVLKVCYCDKLFLGVDSFTIEKGISTPNIEEANINQTMISMAKECIAVFDSSKFNKRSFAFIAHVKDIDAVVTDDDIPPQILSELTRRNIKVHIASN